MIPSKDLAGHLCIVKADQTEWMDAQADLSLHLILAFLFDL